MGHHWEGGRAFRRKEEELAGKGGELLLRDATAVADGRWTPPLAALSLTRCQPRPREQRDVTVLLLAVSSRLNQRSTPSSPEGPFRSRNRSRRHCRHRTSERRKVTLAVAL
ncbi:hypothetical protein MTO96_005336 [Rhipicephalus appendiculatus]